MQIKNNIKIHNRFDIEIVDKNTGEIKQSLVSYNIVLSQMYTRLCGGSSYFVNIHFGSGTGTLAATRTTLFSHLGTKVAVDEEIIKAIPLSTWKRKVVLNPEEFVGNTISEVGIAYGTTNTNLVTHSLLKDSEGNPISIVKTDVDVITIYATVFVTFDNTNPNLIYIGMPSSNALVNYLVGGAVAPTGTFGLNDMYLASNRLGSTTAVTWTSDVPNKQRKTNVPRFATTVGNGHAKFLEFDNLFSLKLPSASIFAGQSYAGVSLGVGDGLKKLFEIPSGNLRESSLVVKKNGVVVSSGDYIIEDSDPLYRGRLRVDANSNEHIISNDGTLLVVLLSVSPFIKTFDIVGDQYIQRPTPAEIPPFLMNAGCISKNNNFIGCFMNSTYYFYDWVGGVWVRRSNIGIALSGNITRISTNNDGSVLALSTNGTPYIEVYDWVGGVWVKRPTITGMTSTANDCKIANNGNTVAVSCFRLPMVIVADWVGGVWVKRPTPPAIPYVSTSSYVSHIDITEDGLMLMCSSNETPFFASYDWDGSVWIKKPHPVDYLAYIGSMKIINNKKGFVVTYGGWSTFQSFALVDGYWIKKSTVGLGGADTRVSATEDGRICASSNYVLWLIKMSRIIFNTPPAVSDVITADYTVDGVHKTDQFVIDASFAIQFGEGI